MNVVKTRVSWVGSYSCPPEDGPSEKQIGWVPNRDASPKIGAAGFVLGVSVPRPLTHLLQVLHELEHRLISFLGVVWDDMGGKGVGLGSVRGGDA